MAIDGDTQIFGVVGDPIRQIKTPSRINRMFEARKSNILCVPFHASSADFSFFWQGMKSIKNVVGFGVTVPHKINAMQLCDSVSPRSETIGVVNVVRRRTDGGFHGDIFDGLSFVQGLIAEGFNPKGHSVYMVGAGGAATAICYALIDAGVGSISIKNRTIEKSEYLVERLIMYDNSAKVRTVKHCTTGYTMLINASSLGMNESDPLPIDLSSIVASQIVAEVVAKPEITKLLREAKQIGCSVHSGIHMITNQMHIIADFIEARVDRL